MKTGQTQPVLHYLSQESVIISSGPLANQQFFLQIGLSSPTLHYLIHESVIISC